MHPLPRIRIAHLPTPLEPMSRLTTFLGGPKLWIKRDDQTGLALGGNKTRKLEYLLAEALANGAQTLITAGALQSNHCRQTAAAAAKYGLGCILVLRNPEEEHEKTSDSGNILIDHLLGAEIVWAPPGQRDFILQQTFETAWVAGQRPYLIPYGGSNATGAAAYAFAVQELAEQLSTDDFSQMPDWIIFASSSGGTQAGFIAGKQALKIPTRFLGISIDEQKTAMQTGISELANKVSDLLHIPQATLPEDVLVNDEYLGEGYGMMGLLEKQAIRLFAQHEGILLDPVYTGRAAAGLIDLIGKKFFSSNEKVLFWHTGGTPALFAQKYASRLME